MIGPKHLKIDGSILLFSVNVKKCCEKFFAPQPRFSIAKGLRLYN